MIDRIYNILDYVSGYLLDILFEAELKHLVSLIQDDSLDL